MVTRVDSNNQLPQKSVIKAKPDSVKTEAQKASEELTKYYQKKNNNSKKPSSTNENKPSLWNRIKNYYNTVVNRKLTEDEENFISAMNAAGIFYSSE